MSTNPKSSSSRRAVGIHVSIAGSIDLAVDRALELGCIETFQIFTSSPRRWNARDLEDVEIGLFRQKSKRGNFQSFAHMPYMPNLASPSDEFYEQSVKVLIRELKRCEMLGVSGLVLHFGSFMGSDFATGEGRVVRGCQDAISNSGGSTVRILLENSAGGRGSIGTKFEKIAGILDKINEPKRTGLCLDTCHAVAAGYELRSGRNIESLIDTIDSTIGLDNLRLIHANDSLGGVGEGKDRHGHIGLGNIGSDGFRALGKERRIGSVPFILETPIDRTRGDFENVAVMKKILGI